MNIAELKDAVAQNKVQHLCLHRNSKGVITVNVNCGAGATGDPLLNPDGSPVTFKAQSEAEQTLINDHGCSKESLHVCSSPLC